MNEMIKGIKETINPQGGKGVTEAIVILIIVVAVIYMNIMGIEIDPIVGGAFGLIAGWLFGNNTNHGDKDE